MEGLSESLRFLGDETRLRILRLLAAAPLSVSELVSLLGVGQPTVSHHLAKLREHDLVLESRDGTGKQFALARAATEGAGQGDPGNGPGNVWPLVKLAVEWQDDDRGDLSRLRELLRTREEKQALNERLLEPGQSWFLWGRALGALLPPLDVADFGCGSGVLTVEMARWARSVVAIDAAAPTLAKAKGRAEAAGPGIARRIRFLKEDLHHLTLKSDSLDLVVVSQSLHHVGDPGQVVAEAARVLKPTGQLAVLEIAPHQEKWVQDRLGHRWLGFEPAQVKDWLARAGLERIELDESAGKPGDSFRVFLFTARKPEEL